MRAYKGCKSLLATGLSFLSIFNSHVNAQSSTTTSAACSSTIAPKNAAPNVAAGWTANVVANGLSSPRDMVFDSNGHLLVVQQGKGVVSLNLDGDGACVRATGNAQDVVVDPSLNHGIALSNNGTILYASGPDAVHAWAYDPTQAKNTSGPTEIISNLGEPNGHVTRTLLASQKEPGILLVSRGSQANIDPEAEDRSSGISTIKAFNLTNITDSGYNYTKDGLLMGWGLRNSVGVAEHPVTGGIYSVENSVDEIVRDGQNIHQDNPGEEMNFHGYLNGTAYQNQGANYGYPSCFAAWNVSAIPDNSGLTVGKQFAIGDQNATVNDTDCQSNHVPPVLTFEAHQAPLDIKFNSDGTVAWVTFHGSWDRTSPSGYKVVAVSFANGSPIADPTSTTAAIDIVSNVDNSKCPDNCFRPVGLAWDTQGRLFMSSDSTGEIYVITQTDGQSANSANPSSGLPPASTSGSGAAAAPSASTTGAAVDFTEPNLWLAMLGAIMAMPEM